MILALEHGSYNVQRPVGGGRDGIPHSRGDAGATDTWNLEIRDDDDVTRQTLVNEQGDVIMHDVFTWDYKDMVVNLTSKLGKMNNLDEYRRVMFLAWRIHAGRIQSCELAGDTPTADRCERYMLSKTVTIPVTFIPSANLEIRRLDS